MARRQPNANVVLTPRERAQGHRGAGVEPAFGACRVPPAADLAHLVEWYWMTWWDRRGQPAHEVEILTDSACHLVFEAEASSLVGVVTRTFTRRLEGAGSVVGIKLRPAALRPFTGRKTSEYTDRRVPLATALAPPVIDVRAVEAELLAPAAPEERAARAEAFVRARRPPPDANVAQLQALLARIDADRDLTTVEQLASRAGLTVRSTQRLFRDYVGVGPKWVIQRSRLLEAAERIGAGEGGNLAELAAALGYFDQAHFAHAFKAMVGRTPAEYARQAAEQPPIGHD